MICPLNGNFLILIPMKYFNNLSKEASEYLDRASYHLFHQFVYNDLMYDNLSENEARMLLSAAIAHKYKVRSDRTIFERKYKILDEKIINELEALPLMGK